MVGGSLWGWGIVFLSGGHYNIKTWRELCHEILVVSPVAGKWSKMNHGERNFLGCSQDVFSPHGQDDFCTRDNWQTAVLYLAQEMEIFGLASPCTKNDDSGEQNQASLDVITLVNSSWKLIQMYRSCQRRFEDMETATRRAASDRERLMASTAKQRDEIEQRERVIAETREQERQASELVEAGNVKLKAAKEEIRKLMSVLLQREAKYSHEIRRAEQESVKLKERLVKVLMEKGEGKGAGVNVMSMSGNVPGGRNTRAQWNTEHSASRREEELVKRVMEEMSKREAAAAEINSNVESALRELSEAVRDSLIELEVDPHEVSSCGSDLSTRSEMLLHQTRELTKLLRESVKKMKKPSEVFLAQEKMSLYEEKLVLYEQILVNFESSKEKQDWILQELKNLQKVSKENLLQEKCQIYESQEQIERMKLELADEYLKLENMKVQFIKDNSGLSDDTQASSPLILSSVTTPTSGSHAPSLPNWAVGPVQVTGSTSARQHTAGTGVVLGYSGGNHGNVSRPVSRPGSRPGSQPGSRAQSVHRDRLDKGKSPAANIITKRTGAGGGGSRMIDTYTASLGRKARPKSATISPSRPANNVNRRSQAASRSPSRSKDVTSSRSSLSLPRHSNQLYLRSNQDKIKRNSGAWSKPPTPGPLSPNTSDSEAGTSSGYSYRSGLPKSSMI